MTLTIRIDKIVFGFRKALTLLFAVSLVGGTCRMAWADPQADTLSGFNATADSTHSATPYIQAATSINIGAPTINLAGEQNTAGDFTVGGNTTVNVTGALNTSGLATLNSATITNNATVGGTLGVTGATTLTGAMTANGGATVNNGAAIHSGVGVGNYVTVGGSPSGTNGVAVGDSQVATVNGNAVSYGTAINGGSLVNGSLGVNGNINSYNGTGNSAIQVANNGLAIAGDSNQVTLTAQGASSANGTSRLNMSPTTTTLLVTNATTGKAHGLSIDQEKTVLSGGTNSTTLTLKDGGAIFAGEGGAPTRVTGVADGVTSYDAVNMKQLTYVRKTAYSGIASVAALAAIPAPAAGNNFSVGMGYGNYGGENAMAVGVRGRVLENVMFTAGMGYGTSELLTPNAGIGYSF